MGGRNIDPTQIAQRMFDRLANGKDVIVIADLPTQGNRMDPNPQATMQAWATTQGITNGQITLDQYTAYMKERMTQMQAGGGAGGRNGPGGGGGMRGGQPRDYDKEAEASFRRYDREGNGLLTVDTMSPELRDEWEKWDANNDGAIDLAEYKAYYKARMAFLRPEQDGTASRDPRNRDNPDNQFDPAQEEEKRPTVYRVGHMPRELPPWFEQLDTDRDGQVGLYEWKRGGREINEFMKIDKNGDGFLTVEEVLRWQKAELAKKREQGTTVALGSEDEDGVPSELPRTISAPGSYSGRNTRGQGGNFTPRGSNGNDPSANPWAPNAGGNNGGPGRGARGGAPGGGGNRGSGGGDPDGWWSRRPNRGGGGGGR